MLLAFRLSLKTTKITRHGAKSVTPQKVATLSCGTPKTGPTNAEYIHSGSDFGTTSFCIRWRFVLLNNSWGLWGRSAEGCHIYIHIRLGLAGGANGECSYLTALNWFVGNDSHRHEHMDVIAGTSGIVHYILLQHLEPLQILWYINTSALM